MGPTWETREDLFAAAAGAGFAMSPSQLGRLHRAGLITEPDVQSLGRGRGTESRFPEGTAARLVRVAQIRTQAHRFADVAWRLWWEDGGLMTRLARQLLTNAAAAMDTQRGRLGEILIDDQADGMDRGLDRLYVDAAHSRLPAPLAKVRRNVRSEDFAVVVHALAAAATDQPIPQTGDDQPSIEVLVDRAFGFGAQRRGDAPAPRIGGEPLDLGELAAVMTVRSASELAASDAAELDAARVDVRALVTLATSIAPVFQRLYGGDALGFATMSRVFASDSPEFQIQLLLAGLALRANGALREGLEQIRRVVAPQALATAQLHAVITQLRAQVPAVAELMSDERLAEAQRDGQAAAALRAQIAEVRKDHVSDFDAFFAGHPETDQLIDLLQQLGGKTDSP